MKRIRKMLHWCIKKNWACEMAQQIKTLATKPDNLSLIVQTHVEERELNLENCSLTRTHDMCDNMYIHIHIQLNKCKNKFKIAKDFPLLIFFSF